MSTAPLPPNPEQLERARRATTIPHRPPAYGDPVLRVQRRPPEEPLKDSYRKQQYRFRMRDADLLLTASKADRRRGLPLHEQEHPTTGCIF